jgi:tRNA pseudouridine55 synthase
MKASSLDGVLLVDKPEGPTSHDVVARVRRLLGTRRVGHAGTLDPMATGLLVVLVGEATKLEPYLATAEKGYLATIAFGRSTDTLDVTGTTTATAAVDEGLVAELASIERSGGLAEAPRIAAALELERQRTEQQPPAHSAIKIDGVRSYAHARAGREVELALRPVRMLELALLAAAPSPPSLELAMRVSKGYYVRSFARDLGAALGLPSALARLRRTRSGSFELGDAVSLDAEPEVLRAALLPLGEAARRSLPERTLAPDDVRRARLGQPLSATDGAPNDAEHPSAWFDERGELVAIGRGAKVVRGFVPAPAVAPGSGGR